MPLCCPQCSEPLARQSDYVKHIYKLMHKCPKCVVKEETDLKLSGKFDEYAKKMYAQNHLDILEQTEREFDDFNNHGFEKFMSESTVAAALLIFVYFDELSQEKDGILDAKT